MNLFELAAERRDAVLAGAKRLTVARGAILYTAGDLPDAVFALLSGRVKIVRTNARGTESIVGIRTPGECFGDVTWMLPGARRSTTAIALDPCELARLEVPAFERLLLTDATLAAAFTRGLAQRLAATERELTELAGKSVPGRLVDALGRLAADHGVVEEDGSLRIGISLTHKDLADLIGTSRETLTKELSVLADVGLLRVAQRTIVLLQPRAFPFASQRSARS